MRITQTMLQNNMLNNLFKSQSQMNKYLTQINTGKKISRPSEDPVVAMQGVSFRTQVREIEQYQRNTNELYNWMNHSEDALDKATKVMQRMEELAVQASNDTYTPTERESVKEEIKQLKEQMIDIANTNVNGKYIFHGTNTDQEPIGENGEINHQTSDYTTVEIEVSKGIKLQANVDPNKAFNESLFEGIDNFITALENNDQEGINDSIKELDEGMTGLVNTRAELGARMNRLELIENRLEEQEVSALKTMSDNEDIDFEVAVTNLLTQEVIHRAALSAGSKIIQPSLVDFLR